VSSRADFIRRHAAVLTPPLTPEIRLHLAHEATELWELTEEELEQTGLPPPYWAFAWAGGQALARYVLDHPETVRGRAVLDFGSGSGLVAIAAAKAGAARVVAAELDAFAKDAIGLNAALNGVAVELADGDLLEAPPGPFETALVGDMFYERELAARAEPWFRKLAQAGALVLVGDPRRSYFPRQGLTELARYSVAVTRALEDSEIRDTGVFRLEPGS
jgi:predicted nicotinamide N-methyase